jgi:hypothetical protein
MIRVRKTPARRTRTKRLTDNRSARVVQRMVAPIYGNRVCENRVAFIRQIGDSFASSFSNRLTAVVTISVSCCLKRMLVGEPASS